MTIAVFANNSDWDELTQNNTEIHWIRVNNPVQLTLQTEVNALFNLQEEKFLTYEGSIPYFINAVATTLKKLNSNDKVIRFNGWPTFISKNTWEISGNVSAEIEDILKSLHKNRIIVADEPGFISARVLSMIINEAYFAIGENVSDRENIDIAMKLGTNYPMGPFEWAEKIGIDKVKNLLFTLAEKDDKYNIAPLLKEPI